MGWLSKLMFWRDDAVLTHEVSVTDGIVEAVEGYTVDGCFVAPEDVVPDEVSLNSDGADHGIDSTVIDPSAIDSTVIDPSAIDPSTVD